MPALRESTALVLFSHGSLLCGAGRTLAEHADRLRGRKEFSRVAVGYLNYSAPAFEEAVEDCVATGATRIVVAPYFLVPGKFVMEDIPRRVALAARHFPTIKFFTAAPMGYDSLLADAIMEMAAQAHPPEHWSDDMLAAPLHCEARKDCPLYATPLCPSTMPTGETR